MFKSFEDQRQALLDFLCPLIEIPSVKGTPEPGAPFGIATVNALNYMLDDAKANGFRVKNHDGYVGWIEFGPEQAPIIAAACHLDVVPVGQWADAFSPKVCGDHLIGRGTSDDKGPAVATYFALKALKISGYQPYHRLRLILGLDEESGSQCLEHYLSVDEVPIAAFTPDADFPVIHAEKGRLGVTYSWDDTFEPIQSSDRIVTAIHGGTTPNIVPEACQITWSDKTTDHYIGKAAHGSTPEEGENAIVKALQQLHLEHPNHPILSQFMNHIGFDLNGHHLGLTVHDEGTGYLTLNVGTFSLNQRKATMNLDIRYPHNCPFENLVYLLHKLGEKMGAKVEINSISPVLYMPMDHPLVATLNRVYQTYTGDDRKPIAIGGNTYAKSLPNTVGFGAVFPGEVVKMHQEGEDVSIPRLLDCMSLYHEAFKALDETFKI